MSHQSVITPGPSLTATGAGLTRRHWPSPSLLVVLLVSLSLASCSNFTRQPDMVPVKELVELPVQHPPLPSPVPPPKISILVITPGETAKLNAEVTAGRMTPYVYMAMDRQDYLTYWQWVNDVLRYIQHSNALLRYYREGGPVPKPEVSD